MDNESHPLTTNSVFVLLVEDDDRLRAIIARNLWARGYTVLQAGGFAEALDRISVKPHLVILDIHLPDGNGWEVAHWLESVTGPVPTIIISGFPPNQKELQHLRPRAFLRKPFEMGELIGLIKESVPTA